MKHFRDLKISVTSNSGSAVASTKNFAIIAVAYQRGGGGDDSPQAAFSKGAALSQRGREKVKFTVKDF